MQVYDPRELGLDVSRISGDEAIVRCPFHEDKHPDNACFNIVTGLFICYSCGAGANVKTLAKRTGGSIKIVSSSKYGKKIEDSEWRHFLELPLALDNQYLKKRKVTDELIKKYGITQSSKGIVIPITNETGKKVGVIMRRFDNHPRYMIYGTKTCLWPLHEFDEMSRKKDLFVVEGVFGALRAMSFGLQATATLGAAIKPEIRKYLIQYNSVVCFDNDYAGLLGSARVLIVVPTSKVLVPGVQADELEQDEWEAIADSPYTTRSIKTLAKMSGKSEKFMYTVHNFANSFAKEQGESP